MTLYVLRCDVTDVTDGPWHCYHDTIVPAGTQVAWYYGVVGL